MTTLPRTEGNSRLAIGDLHGTTGHYPPAGTDPDSHWERRIPGEYDCGVQRQRGRDRADCLSVAAQRQFHPWCNRRLAGAVHRSVLKRCAYTASWWPILPAWSRASGFRSCLAMRSQPQPTLSRSARRSAGRLASSSPPLLCEQRGGRAVSRPQTGGLVDSGSRGCPTPTVSLTFTTRGSTFDTLLGIYSGSSFTNLHLEVENDDSR